MRETTAFAPAGSVRPCPLARPRAFPSRRASSRPRSARVCPRCILRGDTGGTPAEPDTPLRDAALDTQTLVGAGGVDTDADAARLQRVRTRVFCTMLVSYATYYVCRSTFVFSAPSMQSALGLSITDVGIITSAFPTVYGIAKVCFVCREVVHSALFRPRHAQRGV